MRAIPILATFALAAPGFAQSTAFTYQGQLKNGAQLASGPHDFQFRLFDAASGGSPIGPTVCLDNVSVTEGLFVTTLDFGQAYATPVPRFLEVQVRADTGLNCSNTSGLVALSPRLRLSPAPSANHAHSAFALDAPSGTLAGALLVDNAGRVGVGVTAPQATVHARTSGEGLRVQGSASASANTAWVSFFDSAGTRIGYVGDGSTGDNATYLASDTGDVHLSPALAQALTAKNTGNVGIGTTAPAARLDVRGDIRLGAFGELRAAAGEENLRIIRGVISSTGVILGGSAFSVAQTETGKYQITFSPSFAGVPAITATVVDSGPTEALPFLEFAGSSGVLLEVYERSGGAFVNRTVQFMAVGPR